MNKLLVIFSMTFFLSCLVSEEYSGGRLQEYSELNGVWHQKKYVDKTMVKDFSWGRSLYAVASVFIDTGAEKPYLFTQGGLYLINKIQIDNSNNIVIMTVKRFKEQEISGTISIHKNIDNSIWFDSNLSIRGHKEIFEPSAKIFYKISGPKEP